jgi:hypothetical protein
LSDNVHAISVTLKGKGAYDPWIVVYAENPAQAKERVDNVASSGLIESVVAAAKRYGDAAPTTYASQDNNSSNQQSSNSGGWGGSSGGGSSSGQQQEDPGRPSGDAPRCEHGTKVWKNPSDKTWKGWFCPERKRAGTCAAEWVND